MKKILILTAFMMSILLLPSCDGAKPEFKFALDVSANVVDANTNIVANVAGDVTNVTLQNYFAAPAEYLSITAPQGKDAVEWLDDYIVNTIVKDIKASGSGTEYTITVKGYVEEITTGLRFSVDRTYTNRQPNGKLLISFDNSNNRWTRGQYATSLHRYNFRHNTIFA